MENFIAYLEFENGVIVNNANLLPTIATVMSIVEPIIFQKRLSGKIKIEFSNDKMTIAYIGIEPFENVPELMKAIRMSSSAENLE